MKYSVALILFSAIAIASCLPQNPHNRQQHGHGHNKGHRGGQGGHGGFNKPQHGNQGFGASGSGKYLYK